MAAIPPSPTGGADLLTYVGGSAGTSGVNPDDVYLSAYGSVINYLGSLVLDPAVDAADVATVTLAVLEVGSKKWDRRNAPGGEVSIDLEGTGARMAPLDPMTTVYADLDRVLDAHKDAVSGLTFGGGFA